MACRGGGHRDFLFRFKGIRHQKHYSEYDFGYDEFPRGVSHIRRSPFYAVDYAVDYAANDVVLIVLWTLAAVENISYISVVVCFVAFLANDIYSFINWRKIEKRQTANE